MLILTRSRIDLLRDHAVPAKPGHEVAASQIANLTERMDTLTQQMGELTSIFIDSMGIIKEMQSQVRGLQMENRRIIERVFGEDEL